MKTKSFGPGAVLALAMCALAASCGDDDEAPSVGSADMLTGTWQGVTYYQTGWEDGVFDGDYTEDFTERENTYRYLEVYEAGGKYREVEYDRRNASEPWQGRTTSEGTWTYQGNRLTVTYTDEGYTESRIVTGMSDAELTYEVRETLKEDGSTYESLEVYTLKRGTAPTAED